MNNPTNRLKVPIGLFKQANKKKLMNVIKFYYRIKSLKIDGCFLNSTFVNEICIKQFNLSYNTSRKYKKLLLDNKLAFLKDKHLCLISYDKLWESLNVEKINDRYKLIYTTFESFDVDVHLQEIKFNLKKQEIKIKEKYLKKELKADTVKNANKNLKRILLSKLDSSISKRIKEGFDTIRTNLNSNLNINYQITLTCKKVAEIFGLNSDVQGWKIIKSMVYINKIRSIAQKPLIISKDIPTNILKRLNLDSSFFLTSTNVLMKRLPNLISVV